MIFKTNQGYQDILTKSDRSLKFQAEIYKS